MKVESARKSPMLQTQAVLWRNLSVTLGTTPLPWSE